jgi:hypothetical protein
MGEINSILESVKKKILYVVSREMTGGHEYISFLKHQAMNLMK